HNFFAAGLKGWWLFYVTRGDRDHRRIAEEESGEPEHGRPHQAQQGRGVGLLVRGIGAHSSRLRHLEQRKRFPGTPPAPAPTRRPGPASALSGRQLLQTLLPEHDLLGQLRRVEPVRIVDDLGFLKRRHHAGGTDPLVRRARFVVDAALPTATVVVPTDRLAGGREVVESVVDGSPQLVERMPGLIRVIAADAAVLVDEMLMPRGLGKAVAAVVLEHRAEADVEVL